MSASARAEARRKAILSRGTDRLARLTTSARGDDPAYMHPDPPNSIPTIRRSSSNFIGEETTMPTPPSRPSLSPRRQTTEPPEPVNNIPFSTETAPDPSVWSEQQQQQLMQALMAGTRPPESVPGLTSTDVDSSLQPMDNPFAAMLFPQGQGAFPQFTPAGAEGKAPAVAVPALPTRLQKLMPFVHLLSMWALLAYFVLYMEPRVWTESVGNLIDMGGQKFGIWRRWAELGRAGRVEEVVTMLSIQVLPFFWAFTTLQLVLHSARIFSGFDTVQPSTLLSFVLPHLPPPLPSIIVNALKYLQMGSLFLDDLASLLVGIGFIIMFSGWFATS